MPVSRFQELYGMDPKGIPRISVRQRNPKNSKQELVPLVPFEVVVLAEGDIRPGAGTPGLDRPAHMYGLGWSIPGAPEPMTLSYLFMN